MFIFEDPKDAGHFYNYVNTKFKLNDENVYDDIPFLIEGENYFSAFSEIDITTKALNLAVAIFRATLNAALNNEGVTIVLIVKIYHGPIIGILLLKCTVIKKKIAFIKIRFLESQF
ncbi:hypothetical protein [Zobellia nedashkovskayae]|uniref:hypothetical protein n=1 Tax=Zobellia nedashkovskayae TaxID=2779510 RepID=UPI00188DA6C6|nr:hypothetical protein [Zobellia nedashkovskayae]